MSQDMGILSNLIVNHMSSKRIPINYVIKHYVGLSAFLVVLGEDHPLWGNEPAISAIGRRIPNGNLSLGLPSHKMDFGNSGIWWMTSLPTKFRKAEFFII